MRDWSNKMCSQWEGFLERAIIIKLGSYYTLIVELDPEEEVQKNSFCCCCCYQSQNMNLTKKFGPEQKLTLTN